MKQLYKFRPNYFFTATLTAVIFYAQTWKTAANDARIVDFRSPLTIHADTTKPGSISPVPSTGKMTDSSGRLLPDTTPVVKTDTFSLKVSKDSLDAPLKYEASDSAVVLVQNKQIILYGKTKTDYKDISLTAPEVRVDQATQVVTAVNRKDSTGEVVETAHFKSGQQEFTSDTIRYNFKSGVGLTVNTYTQTDGLLFIGKYAKKVNENTTFIKSARFTPCLLDDPHFDIKTDKMKVVNQKLAVSGPAHLEFEGVPIPIYLPFGFYPLSQGRHSGLIPPQFTSNEQYGLGLEGLGYYKVLNEYWDTKVYGNIYSYGGWTLNVNPTYRKRYRYDGALNFTIQTTKLNFKGDPDYRKNKSYFITWNHSANTKARPGTTFSASVNAGSTKFNELVPNSPQVNFQNQLGSSIAYSKTWLGKPYNLTITANHNQNNVTRLINVSLPDVGFTVSTIYPFQKKEYVGSLKWYQKIGVGYSGNFRDQISFYDTAFRFRQLIDTLQWGAAHSFPITMSLPPLFNGAVILSPGVSYQQVWIAQKFRRKWNTAEQKLDTVVTKGFFTDHQMSFSLSLSTAVYGTVQFKKSRILAIRHVIRPTISFNYKPDLSRQHYYSDTVNTNHDVFRFSEFEGALYPGFAEGRTGGISIQIDNNLEMKYRSKKDTGDAAIKKIKLIDGYGFVTGYNFLRDSMKLDMINLYLRTTLFEKISITASSILDPYQTNNRGADISKYAWEGGKFNLGRLTSGSLSLSSSFRSKPKDAKKEAERTKQLQDRLGDPNLIGDQQRLLDYMRQNSSEFVDFNVSWDLSLGLSLTFYNQLKSDYSGYTRVFTTNANFSGGFNLTPKWKLSTNGYYDFKTHQLQTMQFSINRDMHCWQLAINVTPVGKFRYFNFTINPKSAILQDLKINRSRYFSSY